MQSIYLFTFTSTGLQSSQRIGWTSPGSLRTLLDFISPLGMVEPVWLRCLRQLCTLFNGQPVTGAAFLGTGAHGKVFCCTKYTGPFGSIRRCPVLGLLLLLPRNFRYIGTHNS